MKKTIVIPILCCVLLVSCIVVANAKERSQNPNRNNNANRNNGEKVQMVARVDKISDVLEVTVLEGEYGASGEFWILTGEETQIFDRNGKKCDLHDMKTGDEIIVYYSGQVMMSYPPQVFAWRIEIK